MQYGRRYTVLRTAIIAVHVKLDWTWTTIYERQYVV